MLNKNFFSSLIFVSLQICRAFSSQHPADFPIKKHDLKYIDKEAILKDLNKITEESLKKREKLRSYLEKS